MSRVITTRAKTRTGPSALALLFVLTGGACEPSGPDSSHRAGIPSKPLSVGADARFDAAAAALLTCTDLTLHEGLPHQRFETAAFDEERSAKPTEDRHGEFFYVAPIPIGASDVEAIRTALSDPSHFAERDPNVGKLCGGFHPDYAVTWSASGASYEMHVCFGCQEANLYDAASDPVELDLIGEQRPVQVVLRDFHAQRPKRK